MAFPKNHNACKEDPCFMREQAKPADNAWAGWGTNLKPAHEPICMARKPLDQSVAKNVQEYGTGALNIDACRIDSEPDQNQGRFPSNVLGEIPDYQKYFYCPKVSRAERHLGFELTAIPANSSGMFDQAYNQNSEFAGKLYTAIQNETLHAGNNHPTVKPLALMAYLIKLVTPPGGSVLDPFNGSGSTGLAAVSLGHQYLGIDLDQNYVDISIKRIQALAGPDLPREWFE